VRQHANNRPTKARKKEFLAGLVLAEINNKKKMTGWCESAERRKKIRRKKESEQNAFIGRRTK
jgi:hypothetical protein